MPFARTVEPIAATDDELRDALLDAHLPSLLASLAAATGDPAILREDLRPIMQAPPLPQGGLDEEQQAEARAVALGVLRRLREAHAGPELERRPPDGVLLPVLDWLTQSDRAKEYLPLVVEELAPPGQDPRAPRWRKPADVDLSAVIIGAGMSGILAGIRLQQAGIPFTIIEKNTEVGGTWWENSYPGARVDVSNAFYSYSFAQRTDWPGHYSTRETLLDYFRDVAAEYGVTSHVRLDTEVTRAEWDERAACWRIHLATPEGNETVEARALVSAVGQLNRPQVSDIPGLEDFAGPHFHSARWDHSVDLAGKRVAVIGNGASAAQFIPAIAPQVEHLDVFQRTPNWLTPVPHYHDAVPDGQQYLFRHVPGYVHWYRVFLFWSSIEGILPAVSVDDGWEDFPLSCGRRNQKMRQFLEGYLRQSFSDRPDLLEKVIPQYAPGSKRIILDNGAWPEALKRPNVELVTDPIERVTPTGVVTATGEEHRADVLIHGTGFQASSFLAPMDVVGREGASLQQRWSGDARAYMGITVPGFPNFFMLYGPNTNIVVNGSIIYYSECETSYVLECLRLLVEEGHAALEPTPEAHDAYNQWIDEHNRRRAWGVATVNSWYRNEYGRSAQNWPFGMLEYWLQTRAPKREDYRIT